MTTVFHAISDATRRDVLDRLRVQGPLSLSEIAEALPMTRQAVTKHLDILESAGLIERHRRGRERIHTVRGAPLEALSDWLAPWEAEWDERLARLRTHLARDPGGADEDGAP